MRATNPQELPYRCNHADSPVVLGLVAVPIVLAACVSSTIAEPELIKVCVFLDHVRWFYLHTRVCIGKVCIFKQPCAFLEHVRGIYCLLQPLAMRRELLGITRELLGITRNY